MNDSMKKMIACVVSDSNLVNQVHLESIKEYFEVNFCPGSKILLHVIEEAVYWTDVENGCGKTIATPKKWFELLDDLPRTKHWIKSCYKSHKPINKEDAKAEFLAAWVETVNPELEADNSFDDYEYDVASDEDFDQDTFEREERFRQGNKTIEEVRDALLAENEILKKKLEEEENMRMGENRSIEMLEKDRKATQGMIAAMGIAALALLIISSN